MITYNIMQRRKTLASNKILLNKYENMVTRLRLVTDGTIDGNFYMAFKHEDSEEYFYLPFDSKKYLVLDSYITSTSGEWEMILIVTEFSYVLDTNVTELDQTRVTYVSEPLNTLCVQENYLKDRQIESDMPAALHVVLDEFMNAKNQIMEIGDNVAVFNEKADNIEANMATIEAYVRKIESVYDEIIPAGEKTVVSIVKDYM